MFLDDIPTMETDTKALQKDADRLLSLRAEVEIAQAKLDQAQKAYSDFAINEMPQHFKDAGVQCLTTENGLHIELKTKTRLSVKKGNDDGVASRNEIADWLIGYGQGAIVKQIAIVPEGWESNLIAAGIPFEKRTDINSTSLKSVLIGMLGQKETPAVINQDDIPKAISFYQWDEMEVK